MTHVARIEKIEDEIRGVAAQYGVTSWERARLGEWKALRSLTPTQEEILQGVERKVFGECDDGARP
jgi:hypothetical protein